MMLAAPARIVVGEVDRRIDDDDESSSGKHHGRRRASSDGNHANDDHHSEDVSVTLVIDPMCALDLVRHIIAAASHVDPENLRQGCIENLQWGKLAEATGLVSEWPITVVDGALAETRLTFGEDFACWIFQCESSTEVGGAADIFIDVALGPEGVELDVLDGRTEPPTRRMARLNNGVVMCAPFDPDEACALEYVAHRAEEGAAALALELLGDPDPNDDIVPLWEPPPGDDGRA